MDIIEILESIPHRYPMLLVDKVLEVAPGKSLRALKNVTINEPFFQGHFPKDPVMPGVLMIEALAQACSLLAMHNRDAYNLVKGDGQLLFVGIDRVRFKRRVIPGDSLIMKVELIRMKQAQDVYASFDCVAEVDGEIATSAELKMMIKGGSPEFE